MNAPSSAVTDNGHADMSCPKVPSREEFRTHPSLSRLSDTIAEHTDRLPLGSAEMIVTEPGSTALAKRRAAPTSALN